MFRTWRRRRLLSRAAIPDASWDAAVAAHPALAAIAPAELSRVRELALLFLHEKRIEPAVGFTLNDDMRVRLAALACAPILKLGLDCYDGFAAVIVYPDEFVVRDREYVDEAGVVHTGDDLLSGEAWEQGPVILSWPDIEASARGEGYNVVAHEFAHKLDMLDGEADGIPPLHAGMRIPEWRAAFDEAHDDLLERLDRGEEPWLDPYAAQDPAELFAVCAELFFDVPRELRSHYPDVYSQLRSYFLQDPASGA